MPSQFQGSILKNVYFMSCNYFLVVVAVARAYINMSVMDSIMYVYYRDIGPAILYTTHGTV